jgi:hypothetical protein
MAELKLNYQPRQQFLPFHQRDQRFACLVCHRRAGKTVACVNELVLRALYTAKKNARYAYIAPFYRQAKDVAWSYLKDVTKHFAVETRESDLRVVLPNGAWISLYGADNPDALRGIYLDGVVLDEYGDCRPSLWAEVILPTLADRQGFAVFIGTPKGKNHFYEINERAQKDSSWFQMTLKASDSGLLKQEDLQEMSHQMEQAQYDQEFECDFTSAVLGTYYAEDIQTCEQQNRAHLTNMFTPNKPVYVSADLGFSDSTALWFWQDHGEFIDLIDYEEHQGKTLDFYVQLLFGKQFPIEKLYLPHDAKQRTLQTGRGTVEQLLTAGFSCEIVPYLTVQQGIDAARLMLPMCRFDAKTDKGVEALRAYKRQYSEMNKAYQNKPLHDWASNGADSFRYMSLVARTPGTVTQKPKEPIDYMPKYTLNQLFEENEKAPILSIARRRH